MQRLWTAARWRSSAVVLITAGLILASACSGSTSTDSSRPTGDEPNGSTTTSPPESSGAAFYDPPEPLPEAEPGTLIRSEPIGVRAGARGWKVLYHSRSVDGRNIAVSGVVIVPDGDPPATGRTVVAVGPGTVGLADSCASSARGGGVAPALLDSWLDAGYVIAVTDYEGLGTPGLHPYGVGESEGRSTLDAARAAIILPASGASDQVVLYGHSQGGHAAFFAADIAADYAPELVVIGTVAQAPLISLVDAMRLGHASPDLAGFLVMLVRGLNAAYPDQAVLDAVLTDDGIEQSSIVEEACVNGVLERFARTDIDAMLVQNPVDVSEWRTLLESNSLGGGRFTTPLLLTKGDADELLPKALTDVFAEGLCAAGDNVDYRTYQGATHGSVIDQSADDVVAWIAARASGTPPTPTC